MSEVSGATAHLVTAVTHNTATVPPRAGASSGLRRHLETLVALTALCCVDLWIRARGFGSFHRLLNRLPTLGPGSGDYSINDAIATCNAVDRAAAWYFGQVWCLQRSATSACLLRLKGYAAELVIGVQSVPVYAHVWVEIDGTVINDRAAVQQRYTVVERC